MTLNRDDLIKSLESQAIDLREKVLKMIHKAGSGHPGGSLSATDLMTALYFYEMNLNEDPKWNERDRFVLSKGHVAPILYCALIAKGYLKDEELYELREFGSRLQGHPDMKRTPGVEISTGSLGQGFAAAVGMAIGLKRDKSPSRVFALVGDGECGEGQIWESLQAASKYQLDNLTVIVDKNGLQNDGFVEDILPLGDIATKFKAFGCHTVEIDGHSMTDIVKALDDIRDIKGQPKCIVANCVKGKGVSFMENVAKWHGVAPNDEELVIALNDVKEGLNG